MSSREQPSRLNFTNTRRRGGRLRPDYGNRFYFFGSRERGGGSAARPADNFPSEPDLKEGLDTTIIQTISTPAHPMVPEYFPIDNVKYVASYNWTGAEEPTIVVPGSPAIWTGRAVPFTLQPDEGYVWKNVQLPQYPMLPLFAAADAIHDQEAAPPVDWPTVDFVTDHNDLRKLLRWLSPSPGREVQDFRIDVQLVGTKTLVLRRWEIRPYWDHANRSYGHAFAAAMTRAAPDCPSSRHHRVIAYNMLNTKMVVRFGIDACLPSPGSSVATTYFDDSNLAPCAHSSMNAEQTSTSTTTTMSPAINIVRAGTQVPQDALVEVVSRSAYYLDRLDWNELYSQLALSQTPTLRMGVHEGGEFKELREWQLEGSGTRLGTSGQSETQKGADIQDLSAQRRETAVQIVRLERVLQDVQKVAIARGSGPAGSFSLVCEGGKLCVYARKVDSDGDGTSPSGSCLPPDVAARFETQKHVIL
ncbi:hypothetical protein EDB92DRAFT_1951194 [Lactarius akahatsu]|uniref:Uncharacterized protein n=1 Tax=Lactarius akahatsu TaxID=416441 RepID=A0AAD4LAE7_9AGAM|nr:hypothetical protein EDB92DRAFT_1951194 [Lactarius akahatsu]